MYDENKSVAAELRDIPHAMTYSLIFHHLCLPPEQVTFNTIYCATTPRSEMSLVAEATDGTPSSSQHRDPHRTVTNGSAVRDVKPANEGTDPTSDNALSVT